MWYSQFLHNNCSNFLCINKMVENSSHFFFTAQFCEKKSLLCSNCLHQRHHSHQLNSFLLCIHSRAQTYIFFLAVALTFTAVVAAAASSPDDYLMQPRRCPLCNAVLVIVLNETPMTTEAWAMTSLNNVLGKLSSKWAIQSIVQPAGTGRPGPALVSTSRNRSLVQAQKIR